MVGINESPDLIWSDLIQPFIYILFPFITFLDKVSLLPWGHNSTLLCTRGTILFTVICLHLLINLYSANQLTDQYRFESLRLKKIIKFVLLLYICLHIFSYFVNFLNILTNIFTFWTDVNYIYIQKHEWRYSPKKKNRDMFSAFPDLKRISTSVSPLKGMLIPNRKWGNVWDTFKQTYFSATYTIS